ncbi:TasA family protein [Heyndrickxia vini]|uniref:LPXTG cell wall anchor domain-containing protein n=1 Tax=Heyndrickxia vini TaxID=1476025 RepID=A0ABX7E5F8_9BACI|nr:LPXTG cell wall anchor domain-containing protein [Heyndrickxia vini]QQZ10953.1 LPXTG cell wall anchor domain-containing protein [Heyndrickxia vini]
MKKIRKWVPLVLLVFLLMPFSQIAAATTDDEINIETSPHKILFDVDNMKPGDWAVREYTILNNGKQDFEYTASAHFKSGSKKLFKQLKIEISDKHSVLYSGKLTDFDGFDYRKLAKSDKETLTFKVDFPAELGNEYQGLTSKFTIKLYVRGTLGGLLPADGGVLPNTGSNIFNLIIGGMVLVIGGATLYLYQRKKSIDLKKI